MKTKFTGKQLKAALVCTSKDNTRYNINRVSIAGDELVSTDGHRGSFVTIEGEPCEPINVSRKEAERIARLGGANAKFVIDGTALSVDGRATGSVEVCGRPEEFPNLARYLPKEKPKATLCVNARYLAEMAKAAAEVVGLSDAPLLLEVFDEGEPAVLKTWPTTKGTTGSLKWDESEKPAYLGLVMPMTR